MSKAILQIEDEPSDVLFMQMALETAGLEQPPNVARDGREALAYLKGEGPFADRTRYPLPDLVFLDLRLPYVPGLDILKWLRRQPSFAQTPVFVLSSSDQDADVEQAYRLGANAYLVKPSLVSELEHIVRLIKRYWLDSDGPPPDCPEWRAAIVPPPPVSLQS